MPRNMQPPSVGRAVHYQGPGTVYPATVVEVGADDRCTLFVMTHVGSMVLRDIPQADEPTPGHWNWPPFVAPKASTP